MKIVIVVVVVMMVVVVVKCLTSQRTSQTLEVYSVSLPHPQPQPSGSWVRHRWGLTTQCHQGSVQVREWSLSHG